MIKAIKLKLLDNKLKNHKILKRGATITFSGDFMKKIILISLLSITLLIASCANSDTISFNAGIKKIDGLDQKYNSTIKSPPSTSEGINNLTADLTAFKANNKLSKPLDDIIYFKLAFLEAEKLSSEGWQWGKGSTTQYGFGCKGRDRIRESARLRNASAQKGYEAVDKLEKLIQDFPKESKSVKLEQKDALALNAMYFKAQEQAEKDAKIINSFCKNQKNPTDFQDAKNDSSST